MLKELLINVSEEEPPKPFDDVTELIDQMKAGEYIRMLHRKKPLPLIQLLHDNGFECKIKQGQSTAWEIIIWKKQDTIADNYCSTAFK